MEPRVALACPSLPQKKKRAHMRQGGSGRDDILLRAVVLLAITLAHAAVIVLWPAKQRTAALGSRVAMVWLRLDVDNAVQLSPPANVVLRPLQPPRSPAILSDPALDGLPAASGLPTVPANSPAAPAVDWQEMTRLVAEAVAGRIENQAQRRTSGTRREPDPPEDALPSIFIEQRLRHGLGVSATGEAVVWLNDSCYVPLEKKIIEGPGAVTGIYCVKPIGGSKPRGDLFEHLKPRHLERAP
jgi:hypothetical protein